MENYKKLPLPLLCVTWFYVITSVLGVAVYIFLSSIVDCLTVYELPLGTFGSRFHVYIFLAALLEDKLPTGIAWVILAVTAFWIIALLISCIMALGKKKYRFFRCMVIADIVATFGYIVYIVIRDDFYWRWFFTDLGSGLALNVLYFIWFSRTIQTKSNQT